MLSVLLLALALPPAPAQAESPAKPAAAALPEKADDILNYKRLSPTLAVAGAPKPGFLEKLPSMGVTTVIDLRPESEGTAPEKATVEKLGLRYVQVPVTPQTFTKKDAEAVAKALAEVKNGNVLFHCSSSNRVGGVLAVLEAMKGKTVDEALAVGRNAGLKSAPMEAAVRRVIAEP